MVAENRCSTLRRARSSGVLPSSCSASRNSGSRSRKNRALMGSLTTKIASPAVSCRLTTRPLLSFKCSDGIRHEEAPCARGHNAVAMHRSRELQGGFIADAIAGYPAGPADVTPWPGAKQLANAVSYSASHSRALAETRQIFLSAVACLMHAPVLGLNAGTRVVVVVDDATVVVVLGRVGAVLVVVVVMGLGAVVAVVGRLGLVVVVVLGRLGL